MNYQPPRQAPQVQAPQAPDLLKQAMQDTGRLRQVKEKYGIKKPAPYRGSTQWVGDNNG